MSIKNLIIKTAVVVSAFAMSAMPVQAKSGTISADILNVRTAPSTSSDIVGTLNYGDNVTITYEPGNGWYEIYTNGGCYYIDGTYVSGNGSAAATASASTASYDTTSYDTTAADTTAAATQEASTPNTTYLGHFTLTAYCPCAKCCGHSTNRTASGTTPVAGRTVAMGGVPFGTKLMINGTVYTVEDRGTAYGTVDIFMNSHSDALQFGVQSADVYIVNE